MANYMTPDHDPNEDSYSGNFTVPPIPTSSPTPSTPTPKPSGVRLSPPVVPPPPIAPFNPSPATPVPSPSDPPKKFAWIHSLAFKIVAGVILVIIVAILVFGYIVLAKGKTSLGEKIEDTIWSAIINDTNQDQSNLEATITYSDKGSFSFVPSKFLASLPDDAQLISPEEAASYDKDYSFTLTDLVLSSTAKTYTDLTDSNVPKAEINLTGLLTNNTKTFDGSLDIRLRDKEAYIKYDYSNTLKELMDKISEGTATHEGKDKWFKSTGSLFEELQKSLGETKTNNKYKDLFIENRVFDIDSLEGISMLNGKPVAHYSLKMNKEKMSNIFHGIVEDAAENESEAYRDALDKIFDAALEKVEIKKYEVWVGISDKKLYKSSVVINAVSLSNTLNYIVKVVSDPNHEIHKLIMDEVNGTKTNSKDAKRIADMRQMASALELYFNDYNSYPPAEGGKPVGIAPYYIGELPTAPVPPDGECDEFLNTYWYKRLTEGTYTYAFCLGSDLAGLGAGRNVVRQSGIYSDKPAKNPRADIQRNDEEAIYDKIAIIFTKIINDLNYDAIIQIDFTAHTYSEPREIEAPSESEDLGDNYDEDAVLY